ncbi:MAG: 30S ribosomal protein S9 [Candidatus Aenigmarchaeota archaeon]|nr:30S ribosomal protein S9 [Candidatus Aenigmarchaeota archaeon]
MAKKKAEGKKEKKPKVVVATGKRKSAIARATIKEGSGKVLINKVPLDLYQPQLLRLKIREPLMLAGDLAKKVDIEVNIKGGGISGQTDAIRQAIAKGLVEFYGDEKLKHVFLEYDRSLLVFDPRRNEPHKPSRSKKGPRRHKQRSKR